MKLLSKALHKLEKDLNKFKKTVVKELSKDFNKGLNEALNELNKALNELAVFSILRQHAFTWVVNTWLACPGFLVFVGGC